MDYSRSRPVFHQSDEEFDDEEIISHLEEGESSTMNTQCLPLTAQLDNLSISESTPNNIASESTSIPVSQIEVDISNSSTATLRSSDTFDKEMDYIEETLQRMHIEDC
nr:hypothetical protein HmN_000546600 [Hymenolepis microstoma]